MDTTDPRLADHTDAITCALYDISQDGDLPLRHRHMFRELTMSVLDAMPPECVLQRRENLFLKHTEAHPRARVALIAALRYEERALEAWAEALTQLHAALVEPASPPRLTLVQESTP